MSTRLNWVDQLREARAPAELEVEYLASQRPRDLARKAPRTGRTAALHWIRGSIRQNLLSQPITCPVGCRRLQ